MKRHTETMWLKTCQQRGLSPAIKSTDFTSMWTSEKATFAYRSSNKVVKPETRTNALGLLPFLSKTQELFYTPTLRGSRYDLRLDRESIEAGNDHPGTLNVAFFFLFQSLWSFSHSTIQLTALNNVQDFLLAAVLMLNLSRNDFFFFSPRSVLPLFIRILVPH